jgi:hypothetical protein
VLREMLESAEPAIQRTVALMDAANRSAASLRRNVRHSMSLAVDDAEEVMAGLIRHLDDATEDLVRKAEFIEERRPSGGTPRSGEDPKAGAAGKTPFPSNRGVKTQKRGGTGSAKQGKRRAV